MKKILFYTDTPQTGGAELQIFLLAKFLDKEKFTPVLACSKYHSLDKWCSKFEKEGIKVIRINVRHKHDPKHYTQLKKIIKDEEIDLLHAHVWNPASCRYAFMAAGNLPIITTEHDPFKINWLKDFFKKKSLKKVRRIITVSENNKKVLSKLYPKQSQKLMVIHNGIDTTWWESQILRFTKRDEKEIKKNLFHAHENTLIVTSIAELHERKGQKYLIKSIPQVIKKFPNVKFVFIGKGVERKNLEKLAKDLGLKKHVVFLGQQKNIPMLLKASDIFVLPSRREAFGLVNLEAMITPLPVIASKVGGIPEIVVPGETGILVEPEGNFSEALISLISNPEKRKSMAEGGQRRVFSEFDAQKMAQKYEAIYNETISRLT